MEANPWTQTPILADIGNFAATLSTYALTENHKKGAPITISDKDAVLWNRWQITIVIPFFTRGNITTPTIPKGKTFTPRGINSYYPKGILFISSTDLVKSLQMPLNASNL